MAAVLRSVRRLGALARGQYLQPRADLMPGFLIYGILARLWPVALAVPGIR